VTLPSLDKEGRGGEVGKGKKKDRRKEYQKLSAELQHTTGT